MMSSHQFQEIKPIPCSVAIQNGEHSEFISCQSLALSTTIGQNFNQSI